MKKQIRLKLIIVALLGAALAYAGKPAHFYTYHRYSWLRSSIDGSKYYTGMDLTWNNYTKGIDYDCLTPLITCTFLGDPMKIHSDASGNWFYVSDIPQAGIDQGMYVLLNF